MTESPAPPTLARKIMSAILVALFLVAIWAFIEIRSAPPPPPPLPEGALVP